MKKIIDSLDRIIQIVGQLTSYSILLIIIIILYEVVLRYFFNSPTTWVHEVSGWLQTLLIMFGGAYALQKGYFIRVDVLYNYFSKKTQFFIDLLISTTFFVIFAYILIYFGFKFAYSSLLMKELSSTGVWKGPVWPIKFTLPIGSILLVISWLLHILKSYQNFITEEK